MNDHHWWPTPYDYTFLIAGYVLGLRSVIQLDISTNSSIDESRLAAVTDRLRGTTLSRHARRRITPFGPVWAWLQLADYDRSGLVATNTSSEFIDNRKSERAYVASPGGPKWLLSFDREAATEMRITVRHECIDGIGLLRNLQRAAADFPQLSRDDYATCREPGAVRTTCRAVQEAVKITELATRILLDSLRGGGAHGRRHLPAPNGTGPRWKIDCIEAVELRISTTSDSWMAARPTSTPKVSRGARYTSLLAEILTECYRTLTGVTQSDLLIAIPMSLRTNEPDTAANLSTSLSVYDYCAPGAPTIAQQVDAAIEKRITRPSEERKEHLRLVCASKFPAIAMKRIGPRIRLPVIICSNLGEQTSFAATLEAALGCSIREASIHARPIGIDAQSAYAEMTSPTLNGWIMSCNGTTAIHIVSTLGVASSVLQEQVLSACARRKIAITT